MIDTKTAILTALTQLDTTNDEHWTGDGLPRLDALAKLMHVSNVKRGDVTEAAPNFTRDNATLEAPEVPAEPTGATAMGGSSDPLGPDESDVSTAQAADADDATDPAGQPPAITLDESLEGLFDDDEPANEMDEAELAVAEAKAKLEEAEAAANEAKKVVAEAQKDVDRIVAERDANKSPHEDMEARLTYIRRQHQMRAERAGAAHAVLKGINLENLDPRSPLDRAMARKKGFGNRGRPQMPMKKDG